MNFETFKAQAAGHGLVFFARTRLADLDTPVGLYARLAGAEVSFLFESAEQGERVGRYSFFGGTPLLTLRDDGQKVSVEGLGKDRQMHCGALDALREVMADLNPAPLPEGAPLLGGAVGYFSYEMVRQFERLEHQPPDDRKLPHALFFIPGVVYAYDHLYGRLTAVVAQPVGDDLKESYEAGMRHLDEAEAALGRPQPAVYDAPPPSAPQVLEQLPDRQTFEASVREAKEAIAAGDIFQIVLSQRTAVSCDLPPLELYRRLRSVNPSPYLFCIKTPELALVGSSPEALVTVTGGQVCVRPIAGTRPRGKTPEEDEALGEALIHDPKERAEHVMLVDLGRNDVGRVSRFGSVTIERLMTIERYSHVLHLVSEVTGRLREDHDALSALAACFPAGTLSGAPKVRAMELIDALEPVARGPYGGAVGYVSFNGDLDTCIAIRTLVLTQGKAYIQTGAGIVYDSDPATEWQECLHKAGALLQILGLDREVVS